MIGKIYISAGPPISSTHAYHGSPTRNVEQDLDTTCWAEAEPFARPADEDKSVKEAMILKPAHRLFPPTVSSTEQFDAELDQSRKNFIASKAASQRPFRILALPQELQDWATGYIHRTFLQQESAIRSLPTPPLAQVSRIARGFYFENNTFCLSTEPLDLYQKRCRRAMRKFDPEVSQKTVAFLDLVNHGDVKSMRRIVILRGDYHCMPHTCRYWMTVLHLKDGLLSQVEVEEERELELMPNGGMTAQISISFMDWKVIPEPAEILKRWSKKGHRTISRTLLKRLMQKMCGWR